MSLLRIVCLLGVFSFVSLKLSAQEPAQEADIIGNWEIEEVTLIENGVEQDNSKLLNLFEGNIYHYRGDSLFSVSSQFSKEGQYPGKWYVVDGQIFEMSYFSDEWIQSEVARIDEDHLSFKSVDEVSSTEIRMRRKQD